MKIVGRQLGTSLVDPDGGFAPVHSPRSSLALEQSKLVEQQLGVKVFPELSSPASGSLRPTQWSGAWLNEKGGKA